MAELVDVEKTNAKRRVGRSPAYPFIPIQKAIEQARALHEKESTYLAPLASALAAWGYGAKSSGGRQTLATMKYYGLIDTVGEGDLRKVKVSDIARRIILDDREDTTEKQELQRKIALTPVAHKELYEHYPNGLASDGSVQHYLIFEQGFNKEAARELLAEFKETASYAGLYTSAKATDKLPERMEHETAELPVKIAVGDKVQVTVDGVDMFVGGTKVLGFSDDGAWVFIDKSNSAAKIEEVGLLEVATHSPLVNRPAFPSHLIQNKEAGEVVKGERKAVFPISDGDVTLTFPEGISGAGLKRLKRYLDIFLDEQAEAAEAGKAG